MLFPSCTVYLGWPGPVTAPVHTVLVRGNWRTGGPGECVCTIASVK